MLVQREVEEAEQAEWGPQRWEGPGSPMEGQPQKEGPGALEDSAGWPEMAEERQVQVTAGRGKANFHTLPAQQGEQSPESKSEGKPAKEHYNQLLKTSGKERIFNAPRGTRTSW